MSNIDNKDDGKEAEGVTKAGAVTLDEDALEAAAGGALDSFLKLGDIKGESVDPKHKG